MSLPLKVAMWAGAGTIFAGTAYVTAIVAAPAPQYQVSDEERKARFEVLAPTYETSSRQQEVYLGIGRLRKRMLKEQAKGVCLEVGAGTGHNIGFYPPEQCSRVVLCDRAAPMVSAMRTKIQLRLGYTAAEATNEWVTNGPQEAAKATEDEGNEAAASKPPYALAVCSSEALPFPDNSFDTVVDVFGLCSFDQPTLALREMSRVCKPDGKLVLLEHGRGTYSKINWYLDKWAPRHAASWGCWWNRDIRRYLRLSGINTVTREEKHFGTTVYIVAKPWKPADQQQPAATTPAVATKK
jgi:ubiquinone/menaquinone biosynthesis C-methylase UbiE